MVTVRFICLGTRLGESKKDAGILPAGKLENRLMASRDEADAENLAEVNFSAATGLREHGGTATSWPRHDQIARFCRFIVASLDVDDGLARQPTESGAVAVVFVFDRIGHRGDGGDRVVWTESRGRD